MKHNGYDIVQEAMEKKKKVTAVIGGIVVTGAVAALVLKKRSTIKELRKGLDVIHKEIQHIRRTNQPELIQLATQRYSTQMKLLKKETSLYKKLSKKIKDMKASARWPIADKKTAKYGWR